MYQVDVCAPRVGVQPVVRAVRRPHQPGLALPPLAPRPPRIHPHRSVQHLYKSSLYTVSLAGEAGAADPCQPRPPAQWLTLLLGLNMGVQCFLGEVPMFFISGWLLRSVQHFNEL